MTKMTPPEIRGDSHHVGSFAPQATTVPVDRAWQPALRAEFPLLQRVAYLQTGSLAPLANSVRAAIMRALDAEGDTNLAGWSAWSDLLVEMEGVRARLARFLGARPEQIGWTSNTSLALRYAVNTIAWQPGDVLISTAAEHVGTRNVRDGLAERHGVRNVVIPVADGNARLLEDLDRALASEPRARLLVISHVSCQDGRRLPVAEATALAHARGVPVVVDGAQSVGQFPVNVAAIGCDFYVGSAHKWLLGPAGLGYLYAQRFDAFAPDFTLAPSRVLMQQVARSTTPVPLGRRLEIGTESLALRAGLAAALVMLERIGLATIERYVAGLSDRLRAGLASLPGVTLLTPRDPAQSSGITAFAVPGNTLENVQFVVDELWNDATVFVKAQPEHPAVRVSIAAFNNADDVDRLLEALPAILRRVSKRTG